MKTIAMLRTVSAISALLIIGVFFLPSTVSADSKTLEPTRDTYVDAKIPTASYGSIGLGIFGYEAAGPYSKIALMHFDTSSIPAGSVINSAKLTVRIGGCTGSGLDHGLTAIGGYITNGSPAWTESSTYQQLSTSGSSLDGIGSKIVPCLAGSYVVFYATDLVSAWVDRVVPNDGLYLSPVSGGANWTRVMYMREATSASRPKLVIDYSVPYEVVDTPDGGAPTSSSSATPATNTTKAVASSQPIDPDESLIPPTKLTATQVIKSNEVELTWEKSSSDGVEYYRIFRMEIDGDVIDTKIGEVSGTENKFIDKNTEAGKTYSYFLRAVRNQRESKNTDPVQIEIITAAKGDQKSPEVLQEANNKLNRQLILALILGALFATAFIVLALKHRRLHHKHKASINSDSVQKQNRDNS